MISPYFICAGWAPINEREVGRLTSAGWQSSNVIPVIAYCWWMDIFGAHTGVVSVPLTFTVLEITAVKKSGDTALAGSVCISLQVNYRSVFRDEPSPSRSAEINLFLLSTALFFVSPFFPSTLLSLTSIIFSAAFFSRSSKKALHEAWRNITSHHDTEYRPDLWLPTSLQRSLAGQGSGTRAINHTRTM